jgi:putative PIN family toxin of toxin-antitoxin system
MAFDGDVHLYVSPAALDELHDVSSRPKVVRKLSLVAERVEEVLIAIQLAATVIEGFPEPFTYARDPDDAHYVNLALAANAKLIVSRDRDLLDLMDGGRPEGRDFQLQFPGMRILNPVAFLREIGDASPS